MAQESPLERTFTVFNPRSAPALCELEVEAPDRAWLTVAPARFELKPGERREISVRAIQARYDRRGFVRVRCADEDLEVKIAVPAQTGAAAVGPAHIPAVGPAHIPAVGSVAARIPDSPGDGESWASIAFAVVILLLISSGFGVYIYNFRRSLPRPSAASPGTTAYPLEAPAPPVPLHTWSESIQRAEEVSRTIREAQKSADDAARSFADFQKRNAEFESIQKQISEAQRLEQMRLDAERNAEAARRAFEEIDRKRTEELRRINVAPLPELNIPRPPASEPEPEPGKDAAPN